MNIAVFADVHGRILLAFKLVDRYQRETGKQIDLILQCGDMGIFPDMDRLDKGTERSAETDETELGFVDHFVVRSSEVEEILDKTSCPLVCVRGNHEDHQHLDTLEAKHRGPAFPVDCYGRCFVLKTGVLYTPRSENGAINIVGIGRIGPRPKIANPTKPIYIQPHESQRVRDLPNMPIDILLTHDARPGFGKDGAGMQEIGETLDRFAPTYHFHGHTGRPCERRIDANGKTRCCKLADLEWDPKSRSRSLAPCSFGILRWEDREHHSFEIVADRWLKQYTADTWRFL